MRYTEILLEASEQTQNLLSILEPLAASGKTEIAIDDFLSMVNSSKMTSMLMDRDAIMVLLEPSDAGLVKSIEGDTIYFGKTITPVIRKVTDKQQVKDTESLIKKAASQATSELGKLNFTASDRQTQHMLSQLKHMG